MRITKHIIFLIIGIVGFAWITPYVIAQQQQTVAPPSSIEQRIKRDLAGRTILDPTRKLYREKIDIKTANNVINVEITANERRNAEIVYRTRLKLSDNINTYIAMADITYQWDGKAWTIQYIRSRSLDIVSTGKFKNCILVKPERWLLSDHLYFYNNCDVTLLVEGRIFTWNSNGMKKEWRDFAIPVPANGKADFHYETDVEYQIERVERP